MLTGNTADVARITPKDVEAALTANAQIIAVATGRHSVEDLAAAGARSILPTLWDTNSFGTPWGRWSDSTPA
ncbi:MAG: HAD hydrolase-like protein [Egibacteraceae bacterium]